MPMADVRVKHRNVGATAVVLRNGHPTVTSRTGGEVLIATGAEAQGFNPLDLVFASLATCIVLSARISASQLGLLDRFVEANADVTGTKSPQEPYRILQFDVKLDIHGDLDEQQKSKIAHLAEEICTISNTLHAGAQVNLEVGPSRS